MEDLLRHWFGDKTFGRAVNYARSGRVLKYHYDSKERVLSGVINGSGRNVYTSEIDFEYDDFSEPVQTIGECSCPVGVSCKHICAVLLAALKEVGEDKLRIWIFGTERPLCAQKDVNHPQTLENKFGGFSTLEAKEHYDLWLRFVTATAMASERGVKVPEPVKPLNSGRRYILYVLNGHSQDEFSLSLHTSQALKRGGHGALRDFRDLQRLSWDDSPPYSLEDRQLVQQMYAAGYLDPFESHQYMWGGASPEIEGRPPEALISIARTGRLAWGQDERIPVRPVDALKPKLEWYEQGGMMRCRMVAADGAPACLIPTEPPLLLKVDAVEAPNTRRTTFIALMGPVSGSLPADLLQHMINAPAIPRDMLPELQEALAPLPGFDEENLPKVEEVRHVTPIPVLVLDGVPASGSLSGAMPITVAPRARFYFQYDKLRVEWCSFLDELIDDNGVRYPRNHQVESPCADFMSEQFHNANKWRSEAAYQQGDYCLGSLKSWETTSNWLGFLTTIPAMEGNGWQVEIHDSFPYDLVSIDDDDWYGEVEDSEAQEDWFGLKLGIEVDGEKLDLLPLLAKQLNQLPPPDKLAAMKDDLVPIAIGPQRFITVPANRLRLIVVTLLELFGDRGAGVRKSQAPILEELGRGLGLDFAGGETLKALARKLKSFKRLKSVKPPKMFHAELRDYQKKGLAWLQFLREMELGGILADDMGLGKTVQALAHIQLEKERLAKNGDMRPCLMIGPTSLMHNWRREAERFAPELKVVVYHGAKRHEQLKDIGGSDLVLTTYALIQRDFDKLHEHHWHVLVLDESQAIKNPRSKASLYVRDLYATQRLCMTGTPVENNLAELWSQFDFLMPGFLGPKDRFSRFYRTPIERHGDDDRRKQLARRVAPFMLRRTKELVAKELPPKTEILRECELKGRQRDLYETVRSAMEKKVREEIHKKGLARSQIIILDALLKMRQACCDPRLVKVSQAKSVKESAKMAMLCELLDELFSENRRILIFSQFTSMLALIEEELNRRKVSFVKLTGSTTDRDTPVQRFQNGDVPVFLISLKAGGSGLNLTAADTVIHYDPWWNPAVEDQATDRAYRIGQDKPVFVYKLVASGTLEEKMLVLKERKKALAQGVYSGGGQKASGLTAKDLDVLFEPLAAD
ncbi:DEAD/DEAH box helicase [Parendozoicomonas sp. Alg238-R29]|uniref:DEAD/DEAH box helicase n=1 Tax=Parendozoicomonas sp. Alg238-R29 TaxID=2993446 RepID=UPI00248DB4CB|nr:DEAD/DEAH box helicase [Parendozoicomonas sp. Alg238-R29]